MEAKNSRDKLDDEIYALKNTLTITKFNSKNASSEPSESLPGTLKDFYKSLSHLEYNWDTIELVDESGIKLKGRINILKAEEVLHDWEGTVYFKDIDHYDYMENFKVVDYFVSEACVGYIHDENKSDYMRFLSLGDTEAKPLSLDFAGYIELLFACRGFLYWQLVILNLRNGKGDESVVEKFKTYMPQIFPDFKWEEFVGLYERVRIK